MKNKLILRLSEVLACSLHTGPFHVFWACSLFRACLCFHCMMFIFFHCLYNLVSQGMELSGLLWPFAISSLFCFTVLFSMLFWCRLYRFFESSWILSWNLNVFLISGRLRTSYHNSTNAIIVFALKTMISSVSFVIIIANLIFIYVCLDFNDHTIKYM